MRPVRNVPKPDVEDPEVEESNDESASEHDGDEALVGPSPTKKAPKEPTEAPGKKSTKKGPDRNNYRRLKIKSKSSTGKGRFGRRR